MTTEMETKLAELARVTNRGLKHTKALFEVCSNDFEKLYKLEMSNVTHRTSWQTKELLELCDSDFEKLYKVEMALKQQFEYGCPADVMAVERLLKLYSPFADN